MTDNLSDTGFLNVNVTTARNSFPISEARVTVSTGASTVEMMMTDTAGQTLTAPFPTPPFEFSEEPTDNKPYAEYNITVEADGFESVTVNNAQVFPDRVSIQNIRMNVAGGRNDIDVPPNTLWGDFPPNEPEDEVKPLPDGNGYIVLPEPVIPEYIVVHLGAPSNSSARNVWIPFKEYVANVASSEIYSTWPEETIKANVLAIQSFVLNRVYTEWYRGKGYNFTITNNTAFDQLFTYGRNIYGNISNIVDEVFTTYVTKPGIRQPLFTQYCDGVRTSCRGLEQWGSKYLGDDGLSAIEILKNYYGVDIYLEQAEKVQGVPSSYPGEELTIGSTGNDVRTIQTQLNSISNNYPMIIKLKVDGIFGENTQKAVMTFQQIFYMPVTGVVDFATWYEISNIYTAVNRLSELG